MAKIIDGKKISTAVKDGIRDEVARLKLEGINTCLAVIIVGDDPASKIYVSNKERACEYTGIISKRFSLPADTSTEQLLYLIEKLNNDKTVNGILCQLPLPKGIDEQAVIGAIAPQKDVDAFHPVNVGKIMTGNFDFLPCTPAGIMEMLKFEGVEIEGKNCVVIGRSNIVGKPMAMLLLHKNGTVTVCHSKTENLAEVTKKADILVSAVGRAGLVTADMVGDGAVVIDVGMNRDESGNLCGDVLFDEVEKKASLITPVPGGVGPMTIAMLMKNTLTAVKKQNKKECI